MSTWVTMMFSLGADDIETLVDSTFAVVVQCWELLASNTQERAASMIEHLLKKHGTLIRNNIDSVPSLAKVPLLAKYEAEIVKLKTQVDMRQQYQSFSKRCRNENVTVVKQALAELVPFLHQNQSFVHLSAVSEQPDPVISSLIRSVLDACINFTENEGEIAVLCAQSLGLIGCLDHNRVEAVREKRDIVVVSNFERADETIDWVMFLLEEILVKAFLSATNTSAQGFLAYAMQELLAFCAMDTSVTFRTKDTQTNVNYQRWIALPEPVRNTLTPFFSSRYVVTADLTKPAATYPIYTKQLSHGTWLRTFLVDLLQKATGDNAKMLFSVCSRVIRGQDVSIANFLLPFVALNVIVGDNEEHAIYVGQELLAILELEGESGYSAVNETLKLCSEVSDLMMLLLGSR
jgi:serine/threonine-protein kinase ATR